MSKVFLLFPGKENFKFTGIWPAVEPHETKFQIKAQYVAVCVRKYNTMLQLDAESIYPSEAI